MKKPNKYSFFLLIILSAIWGSAFFNYKVTLESYDIFTLSGGRLFFAAIFLIVIYSFLLKKVNLRLLFSNKFYLFFLIGLINYVLPFSLIAFGIKGMSSGLAALLMSAGPFYAIIFGHIFTKDKFNKYKLFGSIIGFLSIVVLVYDQVYLSKLTNIKSVLFVMSASLSYIIGGVLIEKNKKYNNETIASLSMIWGAIILFPLSFFELYKLDFSSVKFESTLSIIYLGIFSTAIAFMMRAKLIFDNGLVFMSQVSFLIPIFGLYFSWLFLNENFTFNMFYSLVLIILGLFILQKGYRKS